ncbi:MAG: cation:proton antiporter [Pirellulales bacterium]|nr:cation:proton antiporter [Pirellulales bacterium]
MDAALPLLFDLFVILTAAAAAATLCRLVGVSMLIGYLLVGTFVGGLLLQPNAHSNAQVEVIAELGVLLLLFSVGLEFTLDDLRRMRRILLLGGSLQMALAAGAVTLVGWLFGLAWRPALLIGFAVALSSTVLVFKALGESGMSSTAPGRAALGVLLFQDMALVPLLLVLPLLTGQGKAASLSGYVRLALVSLGVIGGVLVLRYVIARWLVPLLSRLRSPEVVVLLALVVLVGLTLASVGLGLPAAIGAFAAGLVFSGNRLTAQVDALLLPFREAFAAVFFVSLGLLFDPQVIAADAPRVLAALVGVIAIKSTAAAVALRVAARLPWRAAWGLGLGLAQVGEFAFVLLLEALQSQVLEPAHYNRVLALSLGSLLLTPALLRFGLRWSERQLAQPPVRGDLVPVDARRALVIGAGPVGRQIAGQLEQRGIDVTIVDLSQVNLHAPAQQGFHTVAGDASDPALLRRAGAGECEMIVVCLPNDPNTIAVAAACRAVNPRARILARCRYLVNRGKVRRAGADLVMSEEGLIAEALIARLQPAEAPPDHPSAAG